MRHRETNATPSPPSSDHEGESEISVLAVMSSKERVNERDFSTLTLDELALGLGERAKATNSICERPFVHHNEPVEIQSA